LQAALAEPQAASNAFATAEPCTVDRPSAWDPARVFTAVEFVEHLRSRGARVIDRRAYWQVQCSAHDDREPSLTVRLGEVQPVTFYCHAGCFQNEVLAAAGLSWANLLRRQGTQSVVVRGLAFCDGGHSSNFEPVALATFRARSRGRFLGEDVEPPLVERECVGRKDGAFVVTTPSRARGLMRAVLATWLTYERRGRRELRAVPYASRTVAARLGLIDPHGGRGRRVRDAVARLVEAGVLVGQGTYGRTPLYALAVDVGCPVCAGEVEAAALVGLDDQASAATGHTQAAAWRLVEGRELATVAVAELEGVAQIRFRRSAFLASN
jgi:hypothetical protein